MKIRWKNRTALEEALRDDSGSPVVPAAGKSASPSDPRQKLHVLTKALTAYREMLFAEDLPAKEKTEEASPEHVKALMAATAAIRAKVASEHGAGEVKGPDAGRRTGQGWEIWQWTALAATLCVLTTVTALYLIPNAGMSRDVLLVDGLSAIEGPAQVMRGGTGENALGVGDVMQEARGAVTAARGTAGPAADVLRLKNEWTPGKGVPPEFKDRTSKAGMALTILAGEQDRQLRLVLYDLKQDKIVDSTDILLPDDALRAKTLIRKAVAAMLSRN